MSPVMFSPLLILCLTALRFAEGLGINCRNNYMEDDSYSNVYCFLDNSTSTVSWRLDLPSGQETHLGTCIDVSNCTSFNPFYTIYRYSDRQSYVGISPIRRDLNGSLLVCSEHHTNGSVESVNCTLKIVTVRLPYCNNRGFENYENSNEIFYCEVSKSTNPMIWSLVTSSGYTRHLGTCNTRDNCNSPLSPDFRAERYTDDRGNLYASNISRDTGGTLQCSDGNSTASCILDVYNRAEVERCSVQVIRGNWSALGSCDVTMAYSTFGRYDFFMSEYWKRLLQVFSWSLFEGGQPFTPTVYTNTTTRKVYYRGTYAYSWPLPDMEGQYYHRMDTWPGRISTYVYDSFVVERPTPPSVYCDGVLHEAGRVPCVCNTSSLGSPAGRLIWYLGNSVVVAGQYGVTSLQFPSNVSVDDYSGLRIVCQLDWIIKYNTPMTLLVGCEVKEAGTTSSDRLWGVGAGAGVVLAVAVVVIVVLLVVLYRRGQLLCCRSVPGGEGAVAVRSQSQLYQEDGPHIYSLMQPAGRRGKSRDAAKSKSTPVADPEHAYENTAMDSPI